jgi:hypothetical protein
MSCSMTLLRGSPALLLLLVFSLHRPVLAQETGRPSWKKRWLVSIVVLAAASALDSGASMGRYEANPLLRNAQGRFSPGRSALFKMSGTAGLVAFQALVCRKDPEYYKASATVNLASAGAFGGMAIRSLRMPP